MKTMGAEFKKNAINEAMDRVLKWGHKLAACDAVGPNDGAFLMLQHIAQGLTGLKNAMRNYDETLEFFCSAGG